MKDDEGAGRLIAGTRVLALVLIVSSLASLVLVVGIAAIMFVSMFGGIDNALAFVNSILSDRPLPILGFFLAILGAVLFGLLLMGGFLLQLRGAFDNAVTVQVTDTGLTVEREGSWYWQSSGVDVPFEAITAVEYLDPDESSRRVEFGDWRAPKFFAGRSTTWIRVERDTDPAVYVGSDRPMELAEAIARRASRVENAEPY